MHQPKPTGKVQGDVPQDALLGAGTEHVLTKYQWPLLLITIIIPFQQVFLPLL